MKCKTVLLQAEEFQRDPSRSEIEHVMLHHKSCKKQLVGTPNVSHIYGSGSGVHVPSSSLAMEVKSLKYDFYARMAGIEASVKTIMIHLNISVVLYHNICNVQQPSSVE